MRSPTLLPVILACAVAVLTGIVIERNRTAPAAAAWGSTGHEPPEPGRLSLPIAALKPSTIRDTFNEGRDGRRHEAVDIPAARGTPVLAVDDGEIRKLFTSRQGGLTVYQFDPTQTYCYYYAHLDRYADGLREGQPIRRGDCVGYVGTTGNAPPETPHLHFAIFQLDAEKRWWKGVAIDPYPFLMRAFEGQPD